MDDDGITPMEKFTGTATYIYLKNHHPQGCTVYVLDSIFQGNMSGILKWKPQSRAWIYHGHSTLNVLSVDLVLNPATGYVSPKFHVVFDDEISTVPFIREGTITPNYTDLVQLSS